MNQYESYVSDQFAGRDFWVALKSRIDLIAGKRKANGVFKGKDHYLLEDIARPDEEQLKANLDAMKKFQETYKDIPMYMMLVPNAANIESDKLPYCAVTEDQDKQFQQIKDSLGKAFQWVNVEDTLKKHRAEEIYYHTDHHWTPRAACYVAQAILATQGISAASYEDYTYVHYKDFVGSGGPQNGYEREPIDVINPLLPTEGYLIDKNGQEKKDVFMITTRHSYQAYLGSTRGPWRKFVTGADGGGRKCLVISDSYGNCFIPYLMPYYSEVHSVDLRREYFDLKRGGCTVSEYIEQQGIDEVYFILSTASGINSGYMSNYLWKYL